MKGAQSAEVEGGGYRGDLTIRTGESANGGGDAGRDLGRCGFITDGGEPADPEPTVGRDIRNGWKPYGERVARVWAGERAPYSDRMSRMVRAKEPMTWKSIDVAGNPNRRGIRPVEGRIPTRPV